MRIASVASFSGARRRHFALGANNKPTKLTWTKLETRIPIDDEDMLQEMERIEAMGGDPFFLTQETWIEDPFVQDEMEHVAPSMDFMAASAESVTVRFATDGKGPAPKSSAPKPDTWQGWDGTIDEDAHLGLDD